MYLIKKTNAPRMQGAPLISDTVHANPISTQYLRNCHNFADTYRHLKKYRADIKEKKKKEEKMNEKGFTILTAGLQ